MSVLIFPFKAAQSERQMTTIISIYPASVLQLMRRQIPNTFFSIKAWPTFAFKGDSGKFVVQFKSLTKV